MVRGTESFHDAPLGQLNLLILRSGKSAQTGRIAEVLFNERM